MGGDSSETKGRYLILPSKTVTSAKALDPIAAKLLHSEELEVYNASRKGRQVSVAATNPRDE